MGRIVAAVIAGYAAIGVLVVLSDQIWAHMIPGFSNSAAPPAFYFYASLTTDTLYTILGGYLCATIARAQARRATAGLIVFGELMGLVSQITLWTTVPHWYALSLLVVYPPAVWIGSKIRSRREPTVAAAA